MTVPRASFANGFAPRDGMPLYPSLWRGCIGAWAPCLGPTGGTLRDQSAYKYNGTLTNMDPGTDWVVSNGRYGLDFDGTNDWVSASPFNYITLPITLECWFVLRSVSGFQRLISLHNSGTTNGFLSLRANGTTISANSHSGAGEAEAAGGTLATNTLYHAAAVFRSTTDREVYLNGRSVGTNTTSMALPASVSAIEIGALSWSSLIQLTNGIMFDARVHRVVMTASEIQLAASRIGIAYDLAPFVMPYSEQVVGGFQAAWALRQRLILGGGGGLG